MRSSDIVTTAAEPSDRSCPHCAARTGSAPHYECVRCFSVYCRECPTTDGGRLCPRCGMPQRIVLAAEKPAPLK